MTVRARRPVGLLLGVLAALVLSGCRIDVGTGVTFDAGGGGEVALAVRIDGATLRELDRAGIDPGLDVALGLGADSGWSTERTIDEDGGLVLTYRQAFADGRAATALLEELSADVALQDPAVRLDVAIVTESDGSVRLTGTGAISPPATLGVSLDDVPVGPTGEELARLTEDAVRGVLSVDVPGRVIEHDADVIDGTTLRWALPVGEPRPLTLVAGSAPLLQRLPWWVLFGAVMLLVVAGRLARARLVQRRVGGEAGGTEPDPGAVSPTG